MRALPTDGQAFTVTDALEAADLDFALDVTLDITTQVTLDLEILIDIRTDLVDLVLGQIRHLRVGIELECCAHGLRCGQTNAKDVGERDFQPLFAGDVDASNTCHCSSNRASCSALTLFVTGVGADDHDAAMATNHLAVVAHCFDAGSYFHGVSLLVPVRNTASGEVVRGKFHLHFVTRENTDVVHPHLPGDVSQHFVIVFKFYLEHGVRK